MDVRIITTYACNYDCWFCHHEGWNSNERKSVKNPFIQLDYVKNLLPILKKCGCDSITLSGGEPCLHPEINQLIKMVAEAHVKLTMVTNGSLLDRITDYSLLDILNVSIHSWDNEAYQKNSKGRLQLNDVIARTLSLQNECPSLDLRVNTVIDPYLISHFKQLETVFLKYKTIKLIEQFPLVSDSLSIEAMEKQLEEYGWKFDHSDLSRRKKYYIKNNTKMFLTRVFCASQFPAATKKDHCISNNEISISPDKSAKKCRFSDSLEIPDLSKTENVERFFEGLIKLEGVKCPYE